MKIINPYSGEGKFFKGRGRTGTKALDDYQKMLIEQEKINSLEQQGLLVQERQPKPKRRKSL